MDIYDDVFEDEDADERPSRAPHGAGGVPSRLEGGGTQPLAEGQVALHQAGYRDGAAAGHAIGLQEGFDEGFAQAIQRGCHTGKYLGAVSALKALWDRDPPGLPPLHKSGFTEPPSPIPTPSILIKEISTRATTHEEEGAGNHQEPTSQQCIHVKHWLDKVLGGKGIGEKILR